MPKNIAIVVDEMIQKGGQENLVEKVCEIFPGCHLYSIYASEYWIDRLKKKNINIRTSFIQKIPFFEKLDRYLFFTLIHILGFESLKLGSYDIVISISSRFAHFVVTNPKTLHICYMNSPGRMFWDPAEYFDNETYGFNGKLLKILKPLGYIFVRPFLSIIRLMDFSAAQRVDYFIANSEHVKIKIKKYYQRESEVVHPFIESVKYISVQKTIDKKDYYVIISRLQSWKKIDIAIKACVHESKKLVVIGTGPDLERLKKLTSDLTAKTDGNLVEFAGYVDENIKLQTLKGCNALIMVQKEDFGIVALEAMACGKPVLAFGAGGVLETVLPGKTGEFFNEQNEKDLQKLINVFDSDKYTQKACQAQALKFDIKQFNEKLTRLVIQYSTHHI